MTVDDDVVLVDDDRRYLAKLRRKTLELPSLMSVVLPGGAW
jgi:hypothetical protein